jgi:hypothetical protein
LDFSFQSKKLIPTKMKLFKFVGFAALFMVSCEEAPKTTSNPVNTTPVETRATTGTPSTTTALPIENAALPKAADDAPKAEASKTAADAPKAVDASKTVAAMYECPMKCEKPSAKAGKCGKCKMDLKAIAQK